MVVFKNQVQNSRKFTSRHLHTGTHDTAHHCSGGRDSTAVLTCTETAAPVAEGERSQRFVGSYTERPERPVGVVSAKGLWVIESICCVTCPQEFTKMCMNRT